MPRAMVIREDASRRADEGGTQVWGWEKSIEIG